MKLNEILQKEIQELKRVRDELKVQAHLGRAEAKDVWTKLEAQWPKVEDKLKAMEGETTVYADELLKSTKNLVDEIREGYLKLRK